MGQIRFLFTPDSHGHFIDWSVADELLEYKDRFKPDVVIHGGDWLDLGALREKATPQERSESILEDVSDGKKWLGMLFKGKHKNVLTLGNHDDRIYGFLGRLADQSEEKNERGRGRRSTTSLEEIGARFVVDGINAHLKKLRVEVVPYGKGSGYNIGGAKLGDKTIGGVWFTHGTAHGDGACKTMANLFLGSVFFGDVHTTDYISMPNRLQTFSQCVGSICRDEDMDYQRRDNRYTKHMRGWAAGIIDTSTGECVHVVAKQIGKNMVCPMI